MILPTAEAKITFFAAMSESFGSDQSYSHRSGHRVIEPTQVGSQFRRALFLQVFDNAAFGIVHAEKEGLAIAFDEVIDPVAGLLVPLTGGSPALEFFKPLTAECLFPFPPQHDIERETGIHGFSSQINDAGNFLHRFAMFF